MRFRLIQYFTAASLVAFVLVAAALFFFERQQGNFFKQVQDEESQLFRQTQDSFVKRQDEAARRDLLAINESGNFNLTRIFGNILWEQDFAPFIARAQAIPVDQCRAIADVKDEKTGKSVSPAEKKACYAEVGKQIMALPGFKEIEAKVLNLMKKSTVFKVKAYDMRGITVYSSERKQVGEDKAENPGFKSAAFDGKPKSELTFREKFSAFDGEVNNVDLIGSYQPFFAPGTDKIVAVLEVYSDVTQFMNQIKTASAAMKKTADDNQAKLAAKGAENQEKVDTGSMTQFAIIVALLTALFAALFVIVKRAQTLIETQEKERENTQQQLAQSEKMASLGQMVAGVAHQLNTPLAFSQSNVMMVKDALQSMAMPMQAARTMSEIIEKAEGDQVVLNIARARSKLPRLQEGDVDVGMLQQMLGDVLDGINQMSELVVNLRDFTRLDRAKTAEADLNKSIHTVVYIAKSVISNNIEVVEEYGDLPPVECNISQLNQVFLNLINNAAHAIGDAGRITVRTGLEGERVKVSIADTGKGIPDDVLPRIFELYYTTKPKGEGTGLGLAIAKDIVAQHGGEIKVDTKVGSGTTFSIYLPLRQQAELAMAA